MRRYDALHMNRRGLQAFTLLEVMIALAVLGLTVIVLLGLRNWDIETQDLSRKITVATMLVQEKMVEAELAVDGPPGFGVTAGDFGDRAPGYFWTQAVSPTPLTIDVREVKVRVSWKAPDLQVRSTRTDETQGIVKLESNGGEAVEAVAYFMFKR